MRRGSWTRTENNKKKNKNKKKQKQTNKKQQRSQEDMLHHSYTLSDFKPISFFLLLNVAFLAEKQ